MIRTLSKLTEMMLVHSKEVKQKLSIVRSYFLEIAVLSLTVAVSYLFMQIRGLDKEFRDHLESDRTELQTIVQANNELIHQCDETNRQVMYALHERR